MPTYTDESITRLTLDDSQFSKASDRTIKKLDELKSSLQFDGTVDGFKEIEKAAKKVDMSPLGQGVEAVSLKFNALYAAVDTTFRRMVDRAVDTGERLVKSLTVDNITAGWQKYADKTSAVQTIMASTATQFEDSGAQMEYVEEQLNKLNWFTDETSYAFLDMVNNIGKFTSNNVQLDKAATAMQGISTWAAISGAGIQGASRAMYNLAQAIGLGAVTLMDWKSIELANMGTVEFKQMAMEVGAADGQLIKITDDLYKTTKGTEVTIETFRDSLSEKWFTSDVLIDVLNLYGGFADRLYELSEITDLSATPLIRYVNEYKEGTLDLEEAMTATGLSAEELIGWLEELGSEELDLGRRAFAAAQEAKTFQEAVDATKEAVGTGWMNTFELIFGNYEEAKELWSDLAEGLYEVFVESANTRNGLLRDWKELGGRAYLIEGLYTVFGNLRDGVYFVKETFEDIFPPKTAEELVSMTEGFRNLMELLKPNETTIETIRSALELIFTLLKKLGLLAAVVIAGLEPIWILLGQISGGIIGLIGDITRLFGFSLDKIFSKDVLWSFYEVIYTISSLISAVVRGSIMEVVSILRNVYGFINDIFKTYKANGGGLVGFITAITTNLQALIIRIKNGESSINAFFIGFANGILKIFEYIKSGESIFSKAFNAILTAATYTFGGIALLIQKIFASFNKENIDSNPVVVFLRKLMSAINDSGLINNLGAAGKVILDFVSAIFGAIGGLNEAGGGLQKSVNWIMTQFGTLWDWFVQELTKLGFRDIADVALIILIDRLIAAFRGMVSSFGDIADSVSDSFESLSEFFKNLADGSDSISGKINKFLEKTKYLQMAAAIGVLVYGLIQLSQVPTGQLGIAVASIATVIGLLIVLMKVMEKLSKTSPSDPASTGTLHAANNIIKFAAGVGILASAVALLAQLDLDGLAKGVVGLGVVMAEIAGFVFLLKKMGGSSREIAKVSAGLTAFAVGLTLMTIPIAMMSLIDIPQLLASVSALAIEMIAFGVAAKLMEKIEVGPILAAAGAFNLIAIGLTALVVPIVLLSLMDLAGLAKGILSVVVVLAALTAACVAIGKFGSGRSGAAGMLAASVAMISFAGALTILSVAMTTFNLINPTAFAMGIGTIVVAFGGMAIIAKVASTASLGLLALAAVIISVGASFALFALGVKTLVDAVAEFIVICGVLAAAGQVIGEDFPALVQEGIQNVETILRAFLQMIPNLVGDIAAAAYTFIIAIKFGFLKALPDILNGLMIILIALCDVIAKWGGPLVNALARAIEGMAEELPVLLAAIGDFVDALFAGIGVIVHKAITGLLKAISNAIFGDALTSRIIAFFFGTGEDTVDAYSSGVENALVENQERLRRDAYYTTEGYKNGLEEQEGSMYDAGYNSTQATMKGMADGAGVASPSWITEMIAGFTAEGFLGEMAGQLPNFNDSGFNVAGTFMNGMVSGLEEGGNNVSNVLDSILQMVGLKTQQIKSQVSAAKEARDELLQEKRYSKGLSSKVDNTAKKAGTSSGETFADNFTSTAFDTKSGSSSIGGGGGSRSTAEKVKTAAEKIIESYEDALKELSYLDKKYKGEYDLWTTLNDQARDAEKTAANLEYVNKQIETQTKRTQIAEEKYQKIAKAMGKASAEARDAEIEWIEEQVSLAKLQNEMVELQNKTIEEAAKQSELEEKNAELTYNLWVSSNKNASQTEQLEKKLEYTLKKLEYSSNKVTEATEAYNKALKDYGEEAIETKTALNELLETEKDYADLSAEVEEIQKDIADLENQHAESALENSRLAYDIWEMNNKSASKAEKAARQTSLLMTEYESILRELNKTTKDYHAALAKYGEDSIEAANAYKAMLEADKKRLEKYAELAQQEKEQLTWLTESLSIGLQKAEAEDDLWDSLNENASKEERNARDRLSIIRKRVYAEQELFIMEKQYAQLVEEEGANSDDALQAAIEITKKKAEIAKYVTDEKNKTEELFDIESKNLDFERKRLQVADDYWSVINENATEVEKTSHEIEKTNWEMVLSMKELTLLSEQYNEQVERYGETSDQARSAWESYRDKQKEIIELQNERKALELELIENELSLQSLADTRAKTEYDLWEALNQDADESEKKTKKITYQMSLLESATEKLRVASKKYNYALAAYGEDAKKTQELFNEMLDAQLAYANTYNELKSIQQEIITKNNDILEQLDQSEKVLSYGYNMWESLYDDISDAQKIEAEIKKLGMDLTTQVARANYYGAEWKRAVAKYGENSAEAQSAYLDYLNALNEAVNLQSSLEKKEAELTKKRADDAQALQDAWDEIKAKDLVGGTSIYDELVEMGLSDAEIEAYVREKAGVIEDSIDAEMDFSLDKMQSKAEESLREWGMTWMDGVYEVADDVVTTAGSCIDEMTSIIDQGAAEGKDRAQAAMDDIDQVVITGGQTIVDSTEQALSDMIDTITSNKSEVVDSVKQVINDVATTASAGMTRQFVAIGLAIPLGIEQGIYSGRSNVIQAAINVIEDAIWAAKRAGEIHSPSRPMIWIGTMLDAGVIKGIEQRAGEIAKTMASAVQNGINVMRNVVHTSNTLDFVGQMVAGGIQSAIDGYSYNILEVGREVLDNLASEYDEMVDDVIGENQWLIDALRDYGFDETTHGIEFVVNLDADEARTELENLLLGREDALEYYDELLSMQERNAEKDQSDLAVRAEAQAIAREINRILASIQASEDAITAIVEAGRSKSYDDTIAGKKFEYVQNIYSTKPLSPLDIYRNTNSQLLRFTNWR